MLLGIERLLGDGELRAGLAGRRVALLGHPASVTADLRHTADALAGAGIALASAFGPQHGMKGDKQDNMVESDDERDPTTGIPVFSLYGRVRRPTGAMLDTFDVLLVDLQDVGTRVYTFVTTLRYVLEAAAAAGKSVWVLDRPNPCGRPVEGLRLEPGWESFVGAGPLPMRHGLTMGELARWFRARLRLDVDLHVIGLAGWRPDEGPGWGWPEGERAWVNPSPNAAGVAMARCYGGTVLLEGTTLSEGRGTSHPLEMVGAPDLPVDALLSTMAGLAPQWLAGCRLRPCWFQPTFHKHQGLLCRGLQWHVEGPHYEHARFRPFRLMALLLKSLRRLQPEATLWRDFPYEYETDRLAIDLICGGPFLRRWVDDPAATVADLEARLVADEDSWREERTPFELY